MVSSKLLTKLKSVKTIFGAKYLKDKEIKLDINTDSRSFTKGQTFVALVGESFDGFTYLESVLEKEAKVVVFKSTIEREAQIFNLAAVYPNTVFITVTDTLDFIQELASSHVKAWKNKKKNRVVIGITGSNGKTTHKEMVYYLLNSVFPKKVLATKGNLNNHIGVPLTIFKLEDRHDIAIVEMGMSNPGEIKQLCDIAIPNAGMITNVGPAHIEFMKTIENIFKEKGSLYDAVVKNTKGKGIFVVNADDEWLRKLKPSKGLTTYGENNGAVRVEIKNQKISLNLNKKVISFTNTHLLEIHNLKNLVGTFLFALNLFPKKEKGLILAASSYEQPSMNRSQWVNNIFLDAYNANPSSMKVSLDSFARVMGEKHVSMDDCYFILGDMNELGDHAPKMHKEIAEHLAELGAKHVSFIGRYKEFYKEGFSLETKSYLKKDEFYQEWKMIKKHYKYIFIKASRSLQLETLMNID